MAQKGCELKATASTKIVSIGSDSPVNMATATIRAEREDQHNCEEELIRTSGLRKFVMTKTVLSMRNGDGYDISEDRAQRAI